MQDLLTLWSINPLTSVVIAIVILYMGRKQAHQVFHSTGRALYRTMRLWAFTLSELEKRVAARNKDVLLAHGAKEAEKSIEREFERISTIVQRDLSQYPALHRQICDVIDKIEVDYQNATDAAPLPPAWKDVVETISSIPASGDPAVNKILQNVKNAVEDSHNKTLKAYKTASAQRHKLLADMHPDWRKIQGTLNTVNEKVSSLDDRSKSIDSQMAQYQQIRAQSDLAADSLRSSALTQFFISGLVLVIALLGGLINFQLIAMPMSEMVGGASYIGDMKTSDIAALVIILIEVAMGLFLVESLRITSLFPIISSMDDRMRRKMMVVSFSILLILATIEASLAYMRDLLALDREALNQSLIGVGAASGAIHAQFRWIPSVGQMVMGFILPFALAFVAIPLESFIQSLRVVLGTLTIGLLRSTRVILRMLGGASNHIFLVCRHLYDLVIVLPLGVERLVKVLLNKHKERESLDLEGRDSNELTHEETGNKSNEGTTKTSSEKSKDSKSKDSKSKSKAADKQSREIKGPKSIPGVDLSETMFTS
ncbi:MAG: hypothetical protein ACI93R_002407 [Flavobacteriales bacterium]|jgi:hypothetical protein